MYCKISANKDNLQKENILSAIKILVADDSRELAQQYENELHSIELAKKEREETDRKTLKELVEKIKTTKSEAEKRELNIQIAKLNRKIKAVSVSNFVNLSLGTKQYISAVKLLEKLVITDRFVIEELAGLAANYEKFRGSFMEISHYVFDRVKESETIMTAAADIFDIVNSDFKKYLQGTGKLSFIQILATSREYYKDLAEQAKAKQTLAERIEQSRAGAKLLVDYGNGLGMYELLPSSDGNGGHLSLTFESNEMGTCIGSKEHNYVKLIYKKGHRFFSLRSLNDDGVLEPHCTIHITDGGELAEIKGKSNGNVKFPYVSAVRHFIKEYLGYDKENDDPYHIIRMSELENIGYVDGFDLYDLPADGVELKFLKLYSGDYKYIDFSRLSITRTLTICDKFTARDFQELPKLRRVVAISVYAPFIERKTFKELDNITEDIIIFREIVPVEFIDLITGLKAKVVIDDIDIINFLEREDIRGHENIIADVLINSLNAGGLELGHLYYSARGVLYKKLLDVLNQKQNMLNIDMILPKAYAIYDNYTNISSAIHMAKDWPKLFPGLKDRLQKLLANTEKPPNINSIEKLIILRFRSIKRSFSP